jgi:glycerophosphoryl diester phosphodiesterase
MEYLTQSKDNIFVAAHRGLSSRYPENTMIAFEKAVEAGVDQLETDIRVTKDGELVLHHDYMLDRTTDGHGYVRDTKLSDLLKLDAGFKKGEEFRGTRIPTFIEFLEFAKQYPNLTIDFELKEYPREYRDDTPYRVCDKILRLIDDYGFTDKCVINTFDTRLHEYIFQTYGKKFRQHVYFPICNMVTSDGLTIDPYSYAYCCCMFASFYDKHNLASKEDCEKMTKMGVQPWAGASICDEEGVDEVIERGCTLITCNNPDEILGLLRKKNKHI